MITITQKDLEVARKDVLPLLQLYHFDRVKDSTVQKSMSLLYETTHAALTKCEANNALERRCRAASSMLLGVQQSKEILTFGTERSSSLHLGTINFDSKPTVLLSRMMTIHKEQLKKDYSAYTQGLILNQIEHETKEMLRESSLLPLASTYSCSIEDRVQVGEHCLPKHTADILPAIVQPLIGYRVQQEELLNVVNRLAYYNASTYMNPAIHQTSRVPVVLLHGPPGMGKSHLMRYIQWWMGQIAHKKSIPYFSKQVTSAQKSSYQSASATAAKELMDAMKHKSGLGMLFLDEADVLLPSKRSSSVESDRLFATELQLGIEGASEYVGNCAMLGATNYLDAFEDAFLDRCTLIEMPAPSTKEEYVHILRKKLEVYQSFDVSPIDLEEIGTRLISGSTSIRRMEKIFERLDAKSFGYSKISLDQMTELPTLAGINTLQDILRSL